MEKETIHSKALRWFKKQRGIKGAIDSFQAGYRQAHKDILGIKKLSKCDDDIDCGSVCLPCANEIIDLIK